jgi:hypothetical protein
MSSPALAAPPPSRSSGLRTAAVVAGGLLTCLALALLAAGGVLRWVDGRKDGDGYLTTATERFHTGTYALATNDLDVDGGGSSWVGDHDRFGKLRLRVRSNDGKPVFVGIARTADARRYLAGSAYASVTDVDVSPFRATYRGHAGERPASPAGQGIWAASVHGAGRRQLTWDVEHGSWSVVVMNADGSRGVDADVSAGADVPILTALSWGALGAGLLFGATAGALIYLGVSRRRAG